MTYSIGIIHYVEGKGHASRMLAIAKELENDDSTLQIAGGNGSPLFEHHNYSVYKATNTSAVLDYYTGTLAATLPQTAAAILNRYSDLRTWIQTKHPDYIVTDDPVAATAATTTSIPFAWIAHITSEMVDDILTQTLVTASNHLFRRNADQFFYPTVWQPTPREQQLTTPVGPIATPSQKQPDTSTDILIVPSAYTQETEQINRIVQEAGYDTTVVGSKDWETVDSLLPYIKDANAVICSGYSTIMETAVTGTPCIILPATPEQKDVARRISNQGLKGFKAVESIETIPQAIKNTSKPRKQANGAHTIAEKIQEQCQEK